MYIIVNGWKDIRGSLRVEAHVSKRNERHEGRAKH